MRQEKGQRSETPDYGFKKGVEKLLLCFSLPGEDRECHCIWHGMKVNLAQVFLLFRKRLLTVEDTLNSGNRGDLNSSGI